MSESEKVPKRRALDLIYTAGNLRIIDSILAIPPGLSCEEVDTVIGDSHRFDAPTMLTAMVAQVDASGLAPNFVGVDRSLLNPNFVSAPCNVQDVLLELIRLGEEKLRVILDSPPDLQEQVFAALSGENCTLQALSILDQMQSDIITRLRSLRSTSPIAQAIRQANDKALFMLYGNPDIRRIMISHINPQAVCSKDIYACLERYFSQPRIVYTTSKDTRGRVSHVSYSFYMPNVFKVRLGKEFRSASVGELVENITPDIYRKFEGESIQFDPRTPWGFIALLKGFGAPLPRSIAEQIKADETLRLNIVSEQERLAAIQTYFETH